MDEKEAVFFSNSHEELEQVRSVLDREKIPLWIVSGDPGGSFVLGATADIDGFYRYRVLVPQEFASMAADKIRGLSGEVSEPEGIPGGLVSEPTPSRPRGPGWQLVSVSIRLQPSETLRLVRYLGEAGLAMAAITSLLVMFWSLDNSIWRWDVYLIPVYPVLFYSLAGAIIAFFLCRKDRGEVRLNFLRPAWILLVGLLWLLPPAAVLSLIPTDGGEGWAIVIAGLVLLMFYGPAMACWVIFRMLKKIQRKEEK